MRTHLTLALALATLSGAVVMGQAQAKEAETKGTETKAQARSIEWSNEAFDDTQYKKAVKKCSAQLEDIQLESKTSFEDDNDAVCDAWLVSIEELRTPEDELHEICIDGVYAIEDALGYGITDDMDTYCEDAVSWAVSGSSDYDEQVELVWDYLSGSMPIASSSCFQDAGGCYSACAYLDTGVERGLCGMDCLVDLVSCVGGELGDVIEDVVD